MKINSKLLLGAIITTLGVVTRPALASEYTWNGFSFQASLTDITSATALNSSNNATALSYLTDASVDTGIGDLGLATNSFSANGGILAGTFGGGTYYHQSANDILLVGPGFSGTNYWGTFTVSLLLSNGSQTPGLGFTGDNAIFAGSNPNTGMFFENSNDQIFSLPPDNSEYYYLPLDISSFDTGGLGVTGIELSNFGFRFLDLSYVGVTDITPTPEPGTLALAALGGIGFLIARRRK